MTIRSWKVLAAVLTFAVYLSLLYPYGIQGVAIAIVCASSVTAVISMAQRKDLRTICVVVARSLIGAVLGFICSPWWMYDSTETSSIIGSVYGVLAAAVIPRLVSHLISRIRSSSLNPYEPRVRES